MTKEEEERITSLTLTRTVGEKIFIGEDVTVTVKDVQDRRVRINITAPQHVQILRDNAKKQKKA